MGRRMARLTWTRRYSFRSVHALLVGHHRERKHGHQYFVEIGFSSRPGPPQETSVAKLLALLDRHTLPADYATGETLVEWWHRQLRLLELGVIGVALQETRKNRFTSSATPLEWV